MSSRVRRWVVMINIIAISSIIYSLQRLHQMSNRPEIGVWILYLQPLANRGGVDDLVARAVSNGASFMVVKTHDAYDYTHHGQKPADPMLWPDHPHWYNNCPKALYQKLIDRCHQQGIKVYAWGLDYGGMTTSVEAEMILRSLALGFDGYVFDVESTFCRPERYKDAEHIASYARYVVDHEFSGKLLAYTTFARANEGEGLEFPYSIFNRYCDEVWPQSYHKTIEWDAAETISKIDGIFADKYQRWAESKNPDNIPRPLSHVVEAYNGNSKTKRVTPTELSTLITSSINNHHQRISLWRWELMGTEHWQVIRRFAKPPTLSWSAGYLLWWMWVILYFVMGLIGLIVAAYLAIRAFVFYLQIHQRSAKKTNSLP